MDLLEDRGDQGIIFLNIILVYPLAVHQYLALCGLEEPADQLHKSGLASTVYTH